MLISYLKIAWRNLLRHKGFSLTNILGLAIGLAACLLIYLYVHNEQTYDAYNRFAGRIARVTGVLHSPETDLSLATSPHPMAAALVREDPEIEDAVWIEPASVNVRQGTEVLKTQDFCYSQQNVFSIFSFSFIEGSPSGALSNPNSMVLCRSAARQYFGNRSALGKTLICNGQPYKVTGVFADRPANSDLPIRALLQKEIPGSASWAGDGFDAYTFVLFRQKPDWRHFNQVLATLAKKYMDPELEKEGAKGYSFRFEAEVLTNLHFSANKIGDTVKGSRNLNLLLSALATFILVIALLNYINLSTARAAERMKEVGVRKVIGARPGQLVRQFLGESAFLVAIAWVIAVGLTILAIPLFNKILSAQLSVSGWTVLFFFVLLFPLTVLLAGAWPAIVLSRFRVIRALKGKEVSREKIFSPRKVLTVAQFVIALMMLTGTLLFRRQMDFMAHKDLGIDRSQMVCLPIPPDSASRAGAASFIHALRQDAGIKGISVGSGLPTDGFVSASTTAWSNGKKREFMCNYFFVDLQFLPLLHISLDAGRNLSDSLSTDRTEAFLVNEAFVKRMGWTSPIGQSLEGYGNKGKVVGVTHDFFYKSLHNMVEPAIMIYRPDPPVAVLAKTTEAELPRLKQMWKASFPAQPFDYFFMDKDFEEQYSKDKGTMFLFNIATALAVLISCLGLYGLISLLVLQRTKEVGIRKVLGASLAQLLLLLTRGQLYLIGCATAIAIPVSVMLAPRWLATYAYHASLDGMVFLLPVAGLLLITILVTGTRIYRAARANPIESLRVE